MTVPLPADGKATSGLYVDFNLSFMICSCIKTKDKRETEKCAETQRKCWVLLMRAMCRHVMRMEYEVSLQLPGSK